MLSIHELLEVASGGPSVLPLPPPASRGAEGVPRTTRIVWRVCRHCNARCAQCDASTTSRRSSRDLDTREALHMLGELAAGGVRELVFAGGEPLLRDDLALLVRRASTLGLATHLLTNGVLLAAHARPLADAGLGAVSLGLEVLRSPSAPGSALPSGFDLALSGLRVARAAGLSTGIVMTVRRHNVRELSPMLDLAGRLDLDRFTVCQAPASRVPVLGSEELSAAQWRPLLLELFERTAAAPDVRPEVLLDGDEGFAAALVHWVGGRFGSRPADRVREAIARRYGGGLGASALTIDHRGRLIRARDDRGPVLGDLRLQSYREILAQQARATTRAAAAGER